MFVEINAEFIQISKVNVYTRDKKKFLGADPSQCTSDFFVFSHNSMVYHVPMGNISYLEYYDPNLVAE